MNKDICTHACFYPKMTFYFLPAQQLIMILSLQLPIMCAKVMQPTARKPSFTDHLSKQANIAKLVVFQK